MSGMVGWSSGEGRSMTRNGEARISHVPGVRIAQKRVWLKRRRKARACTYIGGSRAEHRESMTVLHWRVAPARVPAELSKVTASHQPWDSLPSLHFACAIALLYLSTAPSYSWARSKHTFPTTRNFRFHHFSVPFSLFSSSSASFEIFLTHNSSIDLDLISCPPPLPSPSFKKKDSNTGVSPVKLLYLHIIIEFRKFCWFSKNYKFLKSDLFIYFVEFTLTSLDPSNSI